MIWHPKFAPGGTEGYDIGLITFDAPIKLGDHINVVCLPQPVTDEAGKEVIQLGWGQFKRNGESLDELNKSNTRVKQVEITRELLTHVGNDELRTLVMQNGLIKSTSEKLKTEDLKDIWIEAIGKMSAKKYIMTLKGLNPCTGDSAGALILKDGKDRFVLIGMGSYAVGICMFKEGIQEPIYYTKVSKYLDWIKEQTGDN